MTRLGNDALNGPEETLDELKVGGLRILQAKRGYRFSLDPVLLADFVAGQSNARVADLGSGSGIIPLLLSRRAGMREIVGIEIQPAMADRARRSVSLNDLEARVRIVEADVRDLPAEFVSGSFDIVTANPPYRNSGRAATDDERAVARHEMHGGLDDFLRTAAYLLRTGGRFYAVYLAERLAELLALMRAHRLEPKRLRMVQSRSGETARMLLVEGRKNARTGMAVEAPLVVYAGKGRDYTAEVLSIYGITEEGGVATDITGP